MEPEGSLPCPQGPANYEAVGQCHQPKIVTLQNTVSIR